MYVLLYILIGIIVAFVNNYLWAKFQTPEEAMQENSGMLIVMIVWTILWPLSLIGTTKMLFELYKMRKNGNR